MYSSSSTSSSFFQTWYTSPVMISPTLSLYFLYTLSFSNSLIFDTRFCLMVSISLLPKSASFNSSENSSPTSKSGSTFTASDKAICEFSSSTAPSSTISRFLHISRSPLSMLTIMSKLSSEPYFFISICLNTSSRIRIMVSLSMFLNSLNSEKVSTRFI